MSREGGNAEAAPERRGGRKKGLFRFRRYTVHQERCGMKVGTDALLLGGYATMREEEAHRVWGGAPWSCGTADPFQSADAARRLAEDAECIDRATIDINALSPVPQDILVRSMAEKPAHSSEIELTSPQDLSEEGASR